MSKHRSRFFMRIVTPYFILLIILMTITMIFVYMTFADRVQTNAARSGQAMADKTAQQMDTYIGDMDLIAHQVCAQPRIVGYFYNLQNDPDPGNSFDNDLLTSIDISSQLKKILVDRANFYNITIYNNKGDFISSREYITDKSALPSLLKSVDYEGTLSKIWENGGTLILVPDKNMWTNEKAMYITLVRALKNDYSDTAYGIVEVRCNIALLSSIINEDISRSDNIFVIDNSTAKVIYPIDAQNPFVGENGYVTASMDKADWSVALKIPRFVTGIVSTRLIISLVILYILLSAFLFAITSFLGRYITRPIMELTRSVKAIDTPDTELKPADGNAIDEIKELEDSFKKMLSRMNHSIIQEKKAYSLALQAQMNPHFLYNSLSVIGAAGSEAGCETVYDMCIKLSEMLRYVAAYEKVTVPLKEELIHTKNYLSMMKFRYEEYFTYNIDADEELLNMAIPKLTIQPLAENCFMHGFKEKEPPWNIHIEIHGTPASWSLCIRDNGIGIAEDKIREITEQIENAETEFSVGSIGGLGIANTILRLKLTHSRRLSYEIKNNGGTQIMIRAEYE